MLYDLKKIEDANASNKKIILRADVDVPIKDGLIQDESRLNAWFPTLEYLLKSSNTVFVIGHMGRPKGADEKLSLKPVAQWINSKLGSNTNLEEVEIGGFKTFKINENVFVLENLRFFEEEEKNDPQFSEKLSKVGDIYVNDAFASAHRAHASTEGITKFLPAFSGIRIQKEVEELSKVLENPARPLAVMIGGAKIETKLPLVEKMHKFADLVLVGGEIAENDKILLKVQHEQVQDRKSVLLVADLNPQLKDITSKSSENFLQVLQGVSTIVWNGPMGLVEEPPFDEGTKTLAEGIANINAYKILGGGDTVSCIQKIGQLDKFNFVSIGGGAMLEFLAGVKLPGLTALEK